MYPVSLDTADPLYFNIAVFTKKDVKAGEELTIHYPGRELDEDLKDDAQELRSFTPQSLEEFLMQHLGAVAIGKDEVPLKDEARSEYGDCSMKSVASTHSMPKPDAAAYLRGTKQIDKALEMEAPSSRAALEQRPESQASTVIDEGRPPSTVLLDECEEEVGDVAAGLHNGVFPKDRPTWSWRDDPPMCRKAHVTREVVGNGNGPAARQGPQEEKSQTSAHRPGDNVAQEFENVKEILRAELDGHEVLLDDIITVVEQVCSSCAVF